MTTQPTEQYQGPLAGVKVLDFSRILSGPYASMVLADLGAEIIKVEPIEHGDETRNFPPFQGSMSHYYIALNRCKKSIALDLKSPKACKSPKSLRLKATSFWRTFDRA
nr:CoA transferase [Celeribacter baekdonensis]